MIALGYNHDRQKFAGTNSNVPKTKGTDGMKIKALVPADGWFFTHETAGGTPNILRLAVWAVIDGKDGDDQVVGMIGVIGGGDNSVLNGTLRLVSVPPVTGTYKHLDDFTPDEQMAFEMA